MKITCKNCSTIFDGKFCNNCGEKVVEEKDFSIRSIFNQAFGYITNIDSKLFQSFKLLFFHPGKLSMKYCDGIRIPYMKPFQLFLIANVLFFIILSDFDLFKTPSKWFFSKSYFGMNVLDIVNQISQNTRLSIEKIAVIYDARSSSLSKTLLILIIPFIGLVAKLFHLKSKTLFGKHIIYSVHFFTFLLLFFVIGIPLLNLVFSHAPKSYFLLSIITPLIIYKIVSYRNFYQDSWIFAILKGITAVFLTIFILLLYTFMIDYISLYSIRYF